MTNHEAQLHWVDTHEVLLERAQACTCLCEPPKGQARILVELAEECKFVETVVRAVANQLGGDKQPRHGHKVARGLLHVQTAKDFPRLPSLRFSYGMCGECIIHGLIFRLAT